jgi:hypothetical protein
MNCKSHNPPCPSHCAKFKYGTTYKCRNLKGLKKSTSVKQNVQIELEKALGDSNRINEPAIQRYIRLRSKISKNKLNVLQLVKYLSKISDDSNEFSYIINNSIKPLLGQDILNDIMNIKEDFNISNNTLEELYFLVAIRLALDEKQFIKAYLSDDLKITNGSIKNLFIQAKSTTRKKLYNELKKGLGDNAVCKEMVEKELNNTYFKNFILLKDGLSESDLLAMKRDIENFDRESAELRKNISDIEERNNAIDKLANEINLCRFIKGVPRENLLSLARIFGSGRLTDQLNCMEIAKRLLWDEKKLVSEYLFGLGVKLKKSRTQ